MVWKLLRPWFTNMPISTDETGANDRSSMPGHDAPALRKKDDDLNRWPVARAIHRVIATAPPSYSTRIGLYGSWGSGKTSVLNFLEEICRERDPRTEVVVRFSAWQATGESGVIALFYRELLAQLQKDGVPLTVRDWAKKLGPKILHKLRVFTNAVGTAAPAVYGPEATQGITAGSALIDAGLEKAGVFFQFST